MARISRRQMFLRLVGKSITGRGPRVITALAAVTLAATVTAALGNLQLSLRGKLEQQLSAFGPNLWVSTPGKNLLSLEKLRELGRKTGSLIAPNTRGAAITSAHFTVSLYQVDPLIQQKMSGWWRVNGAWPTGPGEGIAGAQLARTLRLKPGSVIGLTGPERTVKVVGILTSGSAEDRSLVVPFPASVDAVQGAEVRAPGDASQIEALADNLRREFPAASVHVLQRVARADTLILARLEEVFGLLGLVIVVASGLCVSTTFSTMVDQRSQEIGLQKALGATDSEVVALFWGEALCLGSAGTLLGCLLGVGFAAWMGQSVFQSPVTPQILVLPAVVFVAIGMTLFAAIPSARRIARIEPALSLRGDAKDLTSDLKK